MKNLKKRRIAGWLAVSLSVVITCIWAFWGISENFHEGWFHASLRWNIGLMLIQYLSPMFGFMGMALISIYWPRVGGSLHGIMALAMIWFFQAFSNAATFLIILPLLLFGALYWYGRLQPRRVAAYLVIGLPLLTLIGFGIEPAIRVSQRVDDGNLGVRVVAGNDVQLTWAPAGPGWPRSGMNWHEAGESCRFLTDDGSTLASSAQDIWRLPSVDEAVRSMARHGENSIGVWNVQEAQASYRTKPDKESPLWDVHSQVIYWWTATELDADRAYIVVYDGKVWPRDKDFGPAYLGFRCVR